MNFLQNKNARKKRIRTGITITIILLVGFLFLSGVFGFFSKSAVGIAKPFWKFGNFFSNEIHSVGSYFSIKHRVFAENQALKAELQADNIALVNENALIDENEKLKELLGRKSEHSFILAVILARPKVTPYDTLLLDVGSENNVHVGQKIYAGNTVLLGEIAEVYPKTSKAILYSSPGQKYQALLKGSELAVELSGKGAGNFEIKIPHDIAIEKGTEVIVPALNAEIVALVQTTISDPRDPFQLVLAQSPINIQQIRFVEVRN